MGSLAKSYIEIADVMAKESGAHFTAQNNAMIKSRIDKRIVELKLNGVDEYLTLIKKPGNQEKNALISLLTTHYTFFMREKGHFDFIVKSLPKIIERAKSKGRKKLKIWCAACSKGDEVYSLAMVLKYHLKKIDPSFTFEILGTDICEASIKHALKGVYYWKELQKVPKEYLAGNWYRGSGDISDFVKVSDDLKKYCRFKTHNLVNDDSPEYKEEFDFVLCRNVFIYFNEAQINKVMKSLNRCIVNKGYLFLGLSETLLKYEGFQNIGQSIFFRTDTDVNSPVQLNKSAKKRILIVDDSATVRKLIKKCLVDNNDFEIVGEAVDGQDGLDKIKELRPDVITLDINMPKMSGHEVIKRLPSNLKVETILISSVSKSDGDIVMRCLEDGAFDYIKKPSFDDIFNFKKALTEKINLAYSSIVKSKRGRLSSWQGQGTFNFQEGQLIAIGASTGGTEAIKQLLLTMPKQFPPILIVQHIPPVFSTAFANRLNELCPFTVKEAVDGEELKNNTVYIAPGGIHMGVIGTKNLAIKLDEETPLYSGHKPSVDYLFENLAKVKSHCVTAALLTGMGADGAKGLLKLKENKSFTITQDEDTSVVYGMPKKAFELGASCESLALDKITDKILSKIK
ncbi:chemotaxis-specific protein-glutamate methyltransferase CheB [Halobacteriovorax sp.]|uniref:chemotaxis-specific protein-glutamate methyltransferase CheB n=1 Tax=Halobacteriovorax sp. TaxID=2020862 RepID=UPI003AF2F15F